MGENILNIAVPFNDLVGTASLPSIVSDLIFEPNTNIDITLTNNNVASADISITFIGHKLFKFVRA